MDWMNAINWFAVQTKPHQERLAAAHVWRLDVEIFLPRVKQDESICGALRTVCKALFPGYFFARFYPLLSFDAVRYAPGVLRVVGDSRFPIPVAPEIITGIRDRVQSDGFVRLDQRPFTSGDRVTIGRGPLAGWLGRVECEWDDGRRVMVLLETIQQARLLVEKRLLAVAVAA